MLKKLLIFLFLMVENSNKQIVFNLIKCTENKELGGIKLVYNKITYIQVKVYLVGLEIPIKKKILKEEIIIFYKPLKQYWGSMLPSQIDAYELYGKSSNPLLNIWLQINCNLENINKEYTKLRILDFITYKTNNHMYKELNNVSQTIKYQKL